MLLFQFHRRRNGVLEKKRLLKATLQIALKKKKSAFMQIPELLVIKLHFLHTLLSYCVLNKKSRKFPWTYVSPWARLPFVWEFLFSFLSKL